MPARGSWGKGKLALEEARVELRRSQRYSYQRRERDNEGHYRWSHTSDVEHTAIETVRLLGTGELAAGQFFEHYLSFILPEDAAPSGDAGLLDTGWSLQLILNRRRAIDVNAGTSFQVLAPAAQSSARIATQARSSTADRCAVLPEIPSRDIQAGATIAGTIIVFARQPVEARQVRVELVRVEATEPRAVSSPTRGRNDSTTVVKQTIATGGTLPVGTPWGFPFTLTVPPDAHPTAFTATRNGAVAPARHRRPQPRGRLFGRDRDQYLQWPVAIVTATTIAEREAHSGTRHCSARAAGRRWTLKSPPKRRRNA